MILSVWKAQSYRVWDALQLPIEQCVQYNTSTQEAVQLVAQSNKGTVGEPVVGAADLPQPPVGYEYRKARYPGSYATDLQGNRVR